MYIHHTREVKLEHPDGHLMTWNDQWPDQVKIILKKEGGYGVDVDLMLRFSHIDLIGEMLAELKQELYDTTIL